MLKWRVWLNFHKDESKLSLLDYKVWIPRYMQFTPDSVDFYFYFSYFAS